MIAETCLLLEQHMLTNILNYVSVERARLRGRLELGVQLGLHAQQRLLDLRVLDLDGDFESMIKVSLKSC